MKRIIIGLAAVGALAFASVASAVTSHDLYPKWNFTSIYVATTDEYLADDPCPDGHHTSVVWRWDGPTQSWEGWFPGEAWASDFDSFEDYGPTSAYWVYCQAN